MLVTLRVRSGSEAGTLFNVTGTQYVIGRHEDCALRIMSLKVSLHHCAIIIRGNEAWVKDLGSTNGTFVNGVRVPTVCRFGAEDVLRVGSYEFDVILQASGQLRKDDRENYESTVADFAMGAPPPPPAKPSTPRRR